MADVRTRGPDTGDRVVDRAQLILVAGLTIAVILVALVLLLNTVIYTENLATRGVDAGGNDAIEYRATVVVGVGELIDQENWQFEEIDETKDSLRAGIGSIDDGLSDQYLRRGVLVEINRSNIEFEEGILVVQDEHRAFESPSNESDWDLATDVKNIRQFSINTDRNSLNETTAENATDDAFTISVDGGTWQLSIYENESGYLSVATTNGSGTTEVCSIDQPEATLDVTGATLDSNPCPALIWADGVDSDEYTIEFLNGDEAQGTYDLTVDDGADLPVIEDILEIAIGEDDQPYSVDAVYSASVDIRYESTDLRFGTTVRIALGEPDA